MNIGELIEELSKLPAFVEICHLEAYGQPTKVIPHHDDSGFKIYII